MIRTIGIGILSIVGFALPSQLVIQPESKVWVDGTSTVRDYKCATAAVVGTIATGSDPVSLATIGSAVTSVHVSIPVAQLACGNGTMDGHMKKALKSTEHEAIEFHMNSYSVTAAEAGVATLELRGTLGIAGTDRPIAMSVQATQDDDGTLRVQGSHELVMSEWGVKPPSLMLGTMKVRDNVVVGFDIRLRQQ